MAFIEDANDKFSAGKSFVEENKHYFRIGQIVHNMVISGEIASGILYETWKSIASSKHSEIQNIKANIKSISDIKQKDIKEKVRLKTELTMLHTKLKAHDIALKKLLVKIGSDIYEIKEKLDVIPDGIQSEFNAISSINDDNVNRENAAQSRRNVEEFNKKQIEEQRKLMAFRQGNNPINSEGSISILPKIFYILAILSLLGGIILAEEFWPGYAGRGMTWKPEAYIISYAWIAASIIHCSLFLAIGRGLAHLQNISHNSNLIMKKLYTKDEKTST